MAVALQHRWQSIQDRLNAAETAVELFCRFSALAARLDAIEHELQQQQQQQVRQRGISSADSRHVLVGATALSHILRHTIRRT
jgi:uncharacterized membrane protein YccC